MVAFFEEKNQESTSLAETMDDCNLNERSETLDVLASKKPLDQGKHIRIKFPSLKIKRDIRSNKRGPYGGKSNGTPIVDEMSSLFMGL